MIQCFDENDARLEAIQQILDGEIAMVEIFFNEKDSHWWVKSMTFDELKHYKKKNNLE